MQDIDKIAFRVFIACLNAVITVLFTPLIGLLLQIFLILMKYWGAKNVQKMETVVV